MLVLKQMVWTTSEEDLKNNHITKSIEYVFYVYSKTQNYCNYMELIYHMTKSQYATYSIVLDCIMKIHNYGPR